jgi:hypothetical protein
LVILSNVLRAAAIFAKGDRMSFRLEPTFNVEAVGASTRLNKDVDVF